MGTSFRWLDESRWFHFIESRQPLVFQQVSKACISCIGFFLSDKLRLCFYQLHRGLSRRVAQGSIESTFSLTQIEAMVDKRSDRLRICWNFAGSNIVVFCRSNPYSFYRPVEQTNRGFKMLQGMGWKEGEGLGRSKQGETEPVAIQVIFEDSLRWGSPLKVGEYAWVMNSFGFQMRNEVS